MNVSQSAKHIKVLLSDNSPNILTAMAVAGLASTTIMAVRATPQAVIDIQHAESEFPEKLTGKEKVQLCWKYYIPASLVGASTVACIVGANSVSNRRNAAIMSVYSLTDTAFKEYKNKVVEQLGENKEQKVRDAVAEDHVKANPVSQNEVYVTGNGDVLCYDDITGRYFNSTMETIRKAQNDINAQCINDMYASLNDFYRAIGVPLSGLGEELGWSVDNMLDVKFSSMIADNDKPCLSINYDRQPIRGYNKFG